MAAASELATGRPVIGIDVSMTWLVVAKKLVSESGGKPFLAAGMAEALPLASDSIPAVVSLDVIEHVHDPDAYLAEIDRVLQPGGRAALSTPNRFSLTAEPHVFVWGVGCVTSAATGFLRPLAQWQIVRGYRPHEQFPARAAFSQEHASQVRHSGAKHSGSAHRLFRPDQATDRALLQCRLAVGVAAAALPARLTLFRITGTKLQEVPAHDFVLSRQVRAAARLGSLAQATQWGMNW